MANKKTYVLLVFICIFYGCSSCDPKCRCKPSKRSATCVELTYIPRFPEYVKSIYFTNNKFDIINGKFMTNLTKNNITSLTLTSTAIRILDEDAFSGLQVLKSLIISEEKALNISDVKKALRKLTASLEYIGLMENGWANIPTDMFDEKAFKDIREIHLSKNKLQEFSFAEVANLMNLHRLELTRNKLITLAVTHSVNLKDMIVDGNDIVRLSSFCNNIDETSLLQKLQLLRINDNALSELTPTMFKCLPSLKTLQLNGNRLTVLSNDIFSSIPQLTELHIQYNKLKKIERNAFKSSSLQRLMFGHNGFHFDGDRRFDPLNIFKHVPKLTQLDLTDNFLPSENEPVLRQMFRHLQNLTSLNLASTYLQKLPTNVFHLMSSLQRLILQGNYLRDWKEGTFENMTNLQYLNLQGNYIQLINSSSFPNELLMRLKTLDLSNNHFSCTCDLMWFSDWLRNKNKTRPKMPNYPYRYKCIYPENMHGKCLCRYHPTNDICTPWNQLYTTAILLSLFGFIIITLLVMAYRCHANIRNYFYLFRIHRLKRRGYIRLNSSEDYEYHAFVVYCDADREWVHNIFLRKLEDDGLKLCVHHRDFDIGASITENIDTYLQKCWKIIVIMSNDFAKSEWCQWEVDFLQERRRQQGKDVFLLIMLKTINSNHMTCPVKTLIKTTPYLTYKGGVGEDLFWKAVIECIQKPLGDPPVAM